MQEALRRTPNHKAAGPDGVPGLVLKHMPPAFHEALHLLFQALAETGITPPTWLQSHTILLYKKGDPTLLENYRPITLANAIYKLWTTCIVILATDYIESRKILSPEQEGFRADRSCARAITHLSLCVEDAHTSKKDIVLCYLDFKGAFPSTDHKQLVRTLEYLGLPDDFTKLVSNLYSGASTEFITPHGCTSPVGIGRGTLQGDPLSPLLFDLMIEPLIRWLNAADKGYHITSCGLKLSSKWYADDGTLVTNSVDDMISLLAIVQQFSDWSGIHLNVGKCKVTAYIHELQKLRRKRDRDDALRARLAHITLDGRPIGSLTQDEPLPGGYLGTSLTASLSPEAHLHWTKAQLSLIGEALKTTPLPPHIKQRLLLYGTHSKITHTHTA